MVYLWIFLGWYVVSAILALSYFSWMNRSAAAKPGNPDLAPVTGFDRAAFQKGALLFVWPTFFFGSIAGGLTVVIYGILL